MQTVTPTDAGSIIVIVGGMALVVLGLLQFLANQAKNGDNKRQELIGKLEAEQLENVRLQGQLITYSDKYKQAVGYARRYHTLYKKYKKLYEDEALKNQQLTEKQ